VTPEYDASPRPLSVDPIGRRTNMTYDTAGPHPKPAAASPPSPEPDGDAPIVVVKPS
jgi:hypothetical protein